MRTSRPRRVVPVRRAIAEELNGFVARIERLEAERRRVADAIRDTYAEARGRGLEVPILRQLIRLRAMAPADRQEQRALLAFYLDATGSVD